MRCLGLLLSLLVLSACGGDARPETAQVLILESSANRSALERKASILNIAARKRPEWDMPDWFSVRDSDQGAELIFGAHQGQNGVDPDEYEHVYKRMRDPKDYDGAGFSQAQWGRP